MMSKSNLTSNTGHRFISKGKTAYKIHIHTPDDTILHRSVGFIRIGEKKALEKALQKRNELGKEMWGKFWHRLLKDAYLMTRLPHDLEPKIIYKSKDPETSQGYYIAKWREYLGDGKFNYRSTVCSIDKHGKLAAYSKAKRALLEAHKENIDLLLFMGRLNSIDLK